MLSSAQKFAAKANQEAQRRYKHQYDKSSTPPKYQIGGWVFVYFPSEETGRLRKLSWPWHGLYRIISRDDPDVLLLPKYIFLIILQSKSINWESRTAQYRYLVDTMVKKIKTWDVPQVYKAIVGWTTTSWTRSDENRLEVKYSVGGRCATWPQKGKHGK